MPTSSLSNMSNMSNSPEGQQNFATPAPCCDCAKKNNGTASLKDSAVELLQADSRVWRQKCRQRLSQLGQVSQPQSDCGPRVTRVVKASRRCV